MTEHPYRNTTSQREREAILRNDQRVNTMHGRAMLELEQEHQGRFARPNTVIAGKGAPAYPAAADWTRARVPDEPPLNFDVTAVEPVGEPWEIRESIRRATPPQRQHGDSVGTASPLGGAVRGVGDVPMVPSPASPIQRKPNVYRRPL